MHQNTLTSAKTHYSAPSCAAMPPEQRARTGSLGSWLKSLGSSSTCRNSSSSSRQKQLRRNRIIMFLVLTVFGLKRSLGSVTGGLSAESGA